MKRIMMAVLVGAVLSAGATWAFAAHVGEALPPDCGANTHAGTDIVDGTTATYTPGTLTVDLKLGGPSCLAADYSVVTLDDDPAGGKAVVLDAISFPGDGVSQEFQIVRRIADEDPGTEVPQICVNIAVTTTQHVESGSVDSSGSSHPGGNGNAPPMQNTSTDTNSVDTETVVDWGSEDEGVAYTCFEINMKTPTTSGSRGYN